MIGIRSLQSFTEYNHAVLVHDAVKPLTRYVERHAMNYIGYFVLCRSDRVSKPAQQVEDSELYYSSYMITQYSERLN